MSARARAAAAGARVGVAVARARARDLARAGAAQVLEVARAAVPGADPDELVPMSARELAEVRATLLGERFGVRTARVSRSGRWAHLELGDGRVLVLDGDAPAREGA